MTIILLLIFLAIGLLVGSYLMYNGIRNHASDCTPFMLGETYYYVVDVEYMQTLLKENNRLKAQVRAESD